MKALWLAVLLGSALAACAQPFYLPTANRAIFEPGGEERYFVPTPGKSWISGTFGCVRNNGQRLHEGLDIKCLQRDRHGEPIDPVLATAEGIVAYINTRPALSTYGNYIVLAHRVEGIHIYSLYAHLREIQPGLRLGQSVKTGEQIAIMGRTAGTREGITKDRAHVHFELNLFVNEKFATWFKQTYPGQRNDHGIWNGYNLTGLDPREILLLEHTKGPGFSLLAYIKQQPELCRVFVRQTQFPWLQRYSSLVRYNPLTTKEAIVGYEIGLNYNGLPFDLIARTASEAPPQGRFHLISVNAAEQERHPCRHLVTRRGGRWELTENGIHLLELITY